MLVSGGWPLATDCAGVQGEMCATDQATLFDGMAARSGGALQISPPLVAGQGEFDELAGILGDVLEEAWQRVH